MRLLLSVATLSLAAWQAVNACICPMLWKPVCKNGKQWGNSCQAECDGVMDATEGPCTDKPDKPIMEKPCSKGCVSWFDGCNTCQCMNGEVGACTEMFCEQKQRPKCLQYGEDDGDNTCKLPKAVGMCKGAFPRFYFDGKSCKQFIYGGCQGNANNFNTMAECQKECGGGDGGDEMCPKGCKNWFDGCNTCKCSEEGKGMCTRKFCAQKKKAMCLDKDDEEGPAGCPADCTSWYDGCNTCRCSNGKIGACTKRFCVQKEEAKCLDSVDIKLPCKKASREDCASRDDCVLKGKKCKDKKEKKEKKKKCKQLKSAEACAQRSDCKAKSKSKRGQSKFQKCIDLKKGR